MQDAVESIPDSKLIFIGFDMDVGCFLADGIHENLVNKPNNGRVGFGILHAVRGIGFSCEGIKIAVLIRSASSELIPLRISRIILPRTLGSTRIASTPNPL